MGLVAKEVLRAPWGLSWGPWLPPPPFGTPAGVVIARWLAFLCPPTLLGHVDVGYGDVEEWYISTVARKSYVAELFFRQCEVALRNLERIHQAVGNKVSVVFITGTDFGMQRGPFISSAMYRELYQPVHRRVNDWVHTHTTWKTFIHSCGSVAPLVNDFVDVGFDILNPVQCSAANMDPKQLKEKHGRRITLWGGGGDTQRTLPFGTPDEVRQEVSERVHIFGRGGGYVFNAIHNIQARVPVENVLAMFEAVLETGAY